MADITMCGNYMNCPKKNTCVRAQATPSFYQSYANFFKLGEECYDYWEMTDKLKKQVVKDN